VLAAVIKGMQTVKLCSNKILWLLTGGAGYWLTQVVLYNGRKMVVDILAASHPPSDRMHVQFMFSLLT